MHTKLMQPCWAYVTSFFFNYQNIYKKNILAIALSMLFSLLSDVLSEVA